MTPSDDKIKVAIVGTGMAGLATGYLLRQDELQRFSVTLFEKGDRISLDAASVTLVDERDGTCSRVDLPMRAFAGGFYRNLIVMYDHLGIRYHAKRFLFAFSDVTARLYGGRNDKEKSPSLSGADSPPHFIHSSNNHLIVPVRPPGAHAIGHLLEVVFVLACYVWYSLCCFLARPRAGESYGAYLRRMRVPQRFVRRYMAPLMSSVATCSHEELLAFPASDLTRYQREIFAADHFVVSHGVQDVAAVLSEGQDIRLASEVLLVEPCGSRVRLVWIQGPGEDVVEEFFGRIVLAIDPCAVAKVYAPLRSVMPRMPTRIVASAVLHGAGQSTTLRVAERSFKQNDTVGVDALVADTLLLRSDFKGSGCTEALHTVNCGAVVATSIAGGFGELNVLHRAAFWRVLRTPDSQEIVNSVLRNRDGTNGPRDYVGWHNGDDGVWLAGGWCWDGMVLLEGCIVSAVRVAQDFGVRIPWHSEAEH
ncbi:uncharacterized protein PG986_002396 [Apiospora aurea]|uniref:Amine oxidase domain-containing protein n=1 Tax=Apiospora aurea TaxID=335848 RepID=A0ABR1QQB5_9PEZI